MTKKSIGKVIRVESIADLENYNLTNYINFVKRSGGQVFQHYSLLESYSNYLGYSSGNGYFSSYKETEVLFSREIFKKKVYSSVILPLYTEDFSTNNFLLDDGKTSTGAPKSFFQAQLTPSWYDRHQNDFACLGGELRNIYKKAAAKSESFFSTGIVLIGGELRLPLLRYSHREVESTYTSNFKVLGGELKKVLLKALMKSESIRSNDILITYLSKSTSNIYDTLELNFKSLLNPEESPKTYSSLLDSYATVVDKNVFKSYNQSIRILNKSGGLKTNFRDNSSSIYCIYNWTLSLNFYPRNLTPESTICYLNNLFSVSLGKDDPSVLEVKSLALSDFNLKSSNGVISINTWYEISIECFNNNLYIYLNDLLIGTQINYFPNSFQIFNSYSLFYLGNDPSLLKGFIGNIDQFTFIKKVAVKTENSLVPNQINTLLASKLFIDNFGNILDVNPNVLWSFQAKPIVDLVNQRIELGSSRYLEASLSEDLSIYDFNNYKLSITFSTSSLPSLNISQKTLIHKTGSLNKELDNYKQAGYHLSLKRIDDVTRILFELGTTELISNSLIKPNVKYTIDVFKYKNYLFLFIDNIFESYTTLNFNLQEDPISDILLGRFRTKPEFDFKGFVYDFCFENYYKDSDNFLLRYLPENLSQVSILNFESELSDDGDLNRIWTSFDEDYRDNLDKKFGDYSLKLSNVNKFIKTDREPVFNLALENFTIETWIKLDSYTSKASLLSNGLAFDAAYKESFRNLYINDQGKIILSASKESLNSNSEIVIESTSTIPLNSWTHVAITRNGGLIRIYLNGLKNKQVTYNNVFLNFSIENTYIGNNNWNSLDTSSQLLGKIDSFRLVKGTALYIEDSFIVPDKPFGILDTNKILDLSFEPTNLLPELNSQLLLNFNPEYIEEIINSKIINTDFVFEHAREIPNVDSLIFNFENAFNNEGTKTIPISTSKINPNDPVFQENVVKFGTKSLRLDRKVMSLTGTTPENNIFMFGTKDFSIDFWTYETSRDTSTFKVIFSSFTINEALVYSYGNTFTFQLNPTLELGWSEDASTRLLNTWNHIALCRIKDNLYLYCNGVLKKSIPVDLQTSINSFGSSGTNFGGSYWAASQDNMTGFIDGFRVVRGHSIFNSNFDTSALGAPKARPYYVLKSDFITVGIEKDTATKHFNSESIKFDINSYAENPNFNFKIEETKDFTLEFDILFRHSDNLEEEIILSNKLNEGFESDLLRISRFNKECIHIYLGGTLILKSDSKLLDNVWYNICITRYKNILKIFVNGMIDVKEFHPEFKLNFLNSGLVLGGNFKGNLESIRLTKDLSLYKSSYQTPNIYFDSTSSNFKVKYKSYSKILEAKKNSIIKTIDPSTLGLKILEDESKGYVSSDLANKEGIKLSDASALDFDNKNFIMEYKARLTLDKTFRVFTSLVGDSSNSIYSSLTSTYELNNKNSIIFKINNTTLISSFSESLMGKWYTVRLERQGDELKLFIDNNLRDTKNFSDLDVNLNYHNSFYLLKNPDGTSLDLDYFYINKGDFAFNNTSDYYKPSLVDVSKEKIEIIKTTSENLIPDGSYFENISGNFNTNVISSNLESIQGFSSYFQNNSYLKLENLPELPSNLIIDFWVFPISVNSTYINTIQSESDLSKGISVKDVSGSLEIKIKSDTGISINLNSEESKILYEEWNCVRIILKEGVLYLYLNGALIEQESNSNPAFYKGSLGKLYLGYSPSDVNTYFNGYIDSLVISKVTLKSTYGYLKYSPLQDMFLKYIPNFKETFILNAEASDSTSGWELKEGTITTVGIENINYFLSSEATVVSSIEQELDFSEYSNIDGKSIFISWSQITNLNSEPNSKGKISLDFFDEYNNLLGTKESNFISTGYKDKGTERYLVCKFPTTTTKLNLKISVQENEGISNIKFYSEDLGDRYFNKSLDLNEEFISKDSFIEPSYAYRYISYNSDFKIEDSLISNVGLNEISTKDKDNILYSDISVQGIKEDYNNDNNIIIR